MDQHSVLDDGESQPCAADLFRTAFIHTVEPFKNARLLLGGNTDTRIGNGENGVCVPIALFGEFEKLHPTKSITLANQLSI